MRGLKILVYSANAWISAVAIAWQSMVAPAMTSTSVLWLSDHSADILGQLLVGDEHLGAALADGDAGQLAALNGHLDLDLVVEAVHHGGVFAVGGRQPTRDRSFLPSRLP